MCESLVPGLENDPDRSDPNAPLTVKYLEAIHGPAAIRLLCKREIGGTLVPPSKEELKKLADSFAAFREQRQKKFRKLTKSPTRDDTVPTKGSPALSTIEEENKVGETPGSQPSKPDLGQ